MMYNIICIMNFNKKNKKLDFIIPSFKQDNLSEKVFVSIRDNILSRNLKEGDKLPSQDILAENYGVSRTVIREAVNKLSSLGLLKIEQGRGTFVHSAKLSVIMDPFFNDLQFERISIKELLEVRYYLEKAIAIMASNRVKPEELGELKKQISVMEKSIADGDIDEFAQADINFHITLAQIAKNDTLKMILNTIRGMMSAFIEKFNKIKGAPERAIRYHKSILKAVEKKNPVSAEKEMAAHIRDVAENLQKHYDYDFDFL